MALTCPIGFDGPSLRKRIQSTYESVARSPEGDFHFHRGASYAVNGLGYSSDDLAQLPDLAVDRFAGVGNPLAIGPIHPGETVLDHACGAGTDLLLAAQRVGATGRVIGIDMTEGMREIASRAIEQAGLQRRAVIEAGVFEQLPVPSASVDVVISNGVVNLSPDKPQVFREIVRVLRPGGRLYLADVVITRELSFESRNDPNLWAACIAGAVTEPELYELAETSGLEAGTVTQHFDSFAGTAVPGRLAGDLRVQGVNFFARKPE